MLRRSNKREERLTEAMCDDRFLIACDDGQRSNLCFKSDHKRCFAAAFGSRVTRDLAHVDMKSCILAFRCDREKLILVQAVILHSLRSLVQHLPWPR